MARECADVERGNECHVDVDGLGATCYSSCTTHYCNDHTRRPTWRDLRRRRLADRRPSADDAPSHTSYSIDNDDTAGSVQVHDSVRLTQANAGSLPVASFAALRSSTARFFLRSFAKIRDLTLPYTLRGIPSTRPLA